MTIYAPFNSNSAITTKTCHIYMYIRSILLKNIGSFSARQDSCQADNGPKQILAEC